MLGELRQEREQVEGDHDAGAIGARPGKTPWATTGLDVSDQETRAAAWE